MGFFYGKAGSADEYVVQISNIHAYGTPARLVQEVELTWMVSLRLANYNPLEAKNILNELTTKELYEAYLVYSFDKFPDDA